MPTPDAVWYKRTKKKRGVFAQGNLLQSGPPQHYNLTTSTANAVEIFFPFLWQVQVRTESKDLFTSRKLFYVDALKIMSMFDV